MSGSDFRSMNVFQDFPWVNGTPLAEDSLEKAIVTLIGNQSALGNTPSTLAVMVRQISHLVTLTVNLSARPLQSNWIM
jgi:hypothetical protein